MWLLEVGSLTYLHIFRRSSKNCTAIAEHQIRNHYSQSVEARGRPQIVGVCKFGKYNNEAFLCTTCLF